MVISLPVNTIERSKNCVRSCGPIPIFGWPICFWDSFICTKVNSDEALAEFTSAKQLETNGDILAGMGYTLGRLNRHVEARQILAEVMELRHSGYIQAVIVALVHLGLGETDEAFCVARQSLRRTRAVGDRNES